MGERVETVTLGAVTLVGILEGPFFDVRIEGTQSSICMTEREWQSLLAISDVLAAADKQRQYERDHSKMLSDSNTALFIEKARVEAFCTQVRGQYTLAVSALRSILSTPAFGQSSACTMQAIAREALGKVGGE